VLALEAVRYARVIGIFDVTMCGLDLGDAAL
jgi:hypothetical protein